MDIFNRILIRFTQGFILLFFTFVLAGYMGLVLLLPLGGFYHLISVLTGLGLNGIIAALIIVPSLTYGLYRAREIDGFYARVVQTGLDLFQMGKSQLCAYEAMLTPKQASNTGSTPAQAS